MEETPGYFVFSLDTELATGYFDSDQQRKMLFSPNGTRERSSIAAILELMERYQIKGTWAIVGHLFYAGCEKCLVCPVEKWKGKYSIYDEMYGSANPLYYAPDVIEAILKSKIDHEIGFHGYTHEIFDENHMTLDQAKMQIHEWKRVGNRRGLTPQSITYPRNWKGFEDLFEEEGFTCYRGEESRSILIRNKYIGRYVEMLSHILSIPLPPIYATQEMKKEGLINLTSSQGLFYIDRKIEALLDYVGLPLMRINRIRKGIHRAANTKKMFHLWAHPWEFKTDKDLQKLEYIFQQVSIEVNNGKMRSVTMGEMADIVRKSSM